MGWVGVGEGVSKTRVRRARERETAARAQVWTSRRLDHRPARLGTPPISCGTSTTAFRAHGGGWAGGRRGGRAGALWAGGEGGEKRRAGGAPCARQPNHAAPGPHTHTHRVRLRQGGRLGGVSRRRGRRALATAAHCGGGVAKEREGAGVSPNRGREQGVWTEWWSVEAVGWGLPLARGGRAWREAESEQAAAFREVSSHTRERKSKACRCSPPTARTPFPLRERSRPIPRVPLSPHRVRRAASAHTHTCPIGLSTQLTLWPKPRPPPPPAPRGRRLASLLPGQDRGGGASGAGPGGDAAPSGGASQRAEQQRFVFAVGGWVERAEEEEKV